MTIQNDIDTLLGRDERPVMEGIVPKYLEPAYKRLGAIEGLRYASIDELPVIAVLMRVIAADDEEKVRDAALSALCEICGDDNTKRIALLVASVDPNERVLTTVLEQAAILDLGFAKDIARKLVNHTDRLVSKYALGLLDR